MSQKCDYYFFRVPGRREVTRATYALTYNVIRTTFKKSLVSWYVYERLRMLAVFAALNQSRISFQGGEGASSFVCKGLQKTTLIWLVVNLAH